MNRMDTIIAGFTTVAVLMICFLTYQILKEPNPKVTKIEPTRMQATPLVSPDTKTRSRSKELRDKAPRLKPTVTNAAPEEKETTPAKPMLIGTTAGDPTIKQSTLPLEEPTPESAPTLVDIHFDFNQGELPEAAQTRLQDYAEILKSGQWEVLIQGHTDPRGSVGFNLRVGQQRAEAVKEYLTNLEVPKDRLHIVSMGEFHQTCKQETEACAELNRRVGFTLIKEENTMESEAVLKGKAEKEGKNQMEAQDSPDKHEGKTSESPSKA